QSQTCLNYAEVRLKMQELILVLYKYATLWSRTTKLSESPLREELKRFYHPARYSRSTIKINSDLFCILLA
ncbi:MAG: hypothetical protein KBT06_07570, partial [Prevotellaceae bacterium]|nr:hypothetical protein [Candidatus Colivivens equi]